MDNYYNTYNKAIVNPLLAKIVICQKLETIRPDIWIGTTYGFLCLNILSNSYIGIELWSSNECSSTEKLIIEYLLHRLVVVNEWWPRSTQNGSHSEM
jgi:hypothetical protein